jgi:hypothetical protein
MCGDKTAAVMLFDGYPNPAHLTDVQLLLIEVPCVCLTCPSSCGHVGNSYSSALGATGTAPYTYSIISGILPTGLTLNADGTITGTPNTAGTFPFTAQVVDSSTPPQSKTVDCGITIYSALVVTCPAGIGQVGVAYSSALVASGGVPPFTFSIVSGSLPAGLTLNTNTGAITGTPTAAGTFPYTAKVVDSTGTAAGTTAVSCGITIASSTPPLTLACAGNSGQVGIPYVSALIATGGRLPYTFAIISGSLPPGLTLNPTTGAITGTPTTAGTFPYTAKVTDSSSGTRLTKTVSCSITIGPTPTYPLSTGDTATIGFWQNKNGQALIRNVNGGQGSTALANWLASNFPYLYGANAGVNNLTGKLNADVAALFLRLFNVTGQKTYAQVLAGALAVYMTDSDYSGTLATQYGFHVTSTGAGAKTYNVGSYGSAIGLVNNTSYTVLKLLQQANLQIKNGTFNANAFNAVFDGINQKGDIH